MVFLGLGPDFYCRPALQCGTLAGSGFIGIGCTAPEVLEAPLHQHPLDYPPYHAGGPGHLEHQALHPQPPHPLQHQPILHQEPAGPGGLQTVHPCGPAWESSTMDSNCNLTSLPPVKNDHYNTSNSCGPMSSKSIALVLLSFTFNYY